MTPPASSMTPPQIAWVEADDAADLAAFLRTKPRAE